MLPRASWLTPATLQRGVPLFSLEREAREEEHLVPPMCWVPTHPQHWQRPATPHTTCGVSQLLPPLSHIPSGSFPNATARQVSRLNGTTAPTTAHQADNLSGTTVFPTSHCIEKQGGEIGEMSSPNVLGAHPPPALATPCHTPHNVWCQSVVAPFEPHPQRLLPQRHRPIAWKTFQGSPHDQRFESPFQVLHLSGTTAPEGKKYSDPHL